MNYLRGCVGIDAENRPMYDGKSSVREFLNEYMQYAQKYRWGTASDWSENLKYCVQEDVKDQVMEIIYGDEYDSEEMYEAQPRKWKSVKESMIKIFGADETPEKLLFRKEESFASSDFKMKENETVRRGHHVSINC